MKKVGHLDNHPESSPSQSRWTTKRNAQSIRREKVVQQRDDCIKTSLCPFAILVVEEENFFDVGFDRVESNLQRDVLAEGPPRSFDIVGIQSGSFGFTKFCEWLTV